MRAMAVACVASLLLSGCVGLLGNADEVPALTFRDDVGDAARAWKADATLYGIFGVELQYVPGEGENRTEEEDEDEPQDPSDPEPGNGKAPVWRYIYFSPSTNMSAVFRVLANGTVDLEDEDEDEEGDDLPVDGMKVDSDAAVKTARANTTFSEAAGSSAQFVESLTNTPEDGLAWHVVAYGGDGLVIAAIDAVSGDVKWVRELALEIPDFNPGFPFGPGGIPRKLVLEEEGTVTPGSPVEFPFVVRGAGESGELELQIGKTLPQEGVDWAIEGPDGEVVVEGRLATPTAARSESRSFPFTLGTPGRHTLVLGYYSPAPVTPPAASVSFELELYLGMKDVPGTW